MILKRNFNPLKVLGYVWVEMTVALLCSLGVYMLWSLGVLTFSIPFSVAATLGSALAIFIAFRNNSAYSRWWEARTLWAGITTSSRLLGRLIITFADSHAHQPDYNKERSEQFKKEIIYRLIAWCHALHLQLRTVNNWQQLQAFLQEAEYNQLINSQNKPNYLQLMMGKSIYAAMANGTLAGFDSFQLEGQLAALAAHQGGCERIKATPLLRQYHYFTRVFLFAFMLFLPLCLIGDFVRSGMAWLVIPVSLIVSLVFAIIGKVGEVNEDPFENKKTDVPLTALCNTIERDLKEMLGEPSLPSQINATNGYLL